MAILNPYISFRSSAREAMDFYRSVFGGELTVSTFAEYPGMTDDPAEQNLVMHAMLTTPAGFTLMAADTPASMAYAAPAGISVSVSGTEAEVAPYWDALADGGTIQLPFETPPWGGKFGMVTDRFGVDWMIAANSEQ